MILTPRSSKIRCPIKPLLVVSGALAWGSGRLARGQGRTGSFPPAGQPDIFRSQSPASSARECSETPIAQSQMSGRWKVPAEMRAAVQQDIGSMQRGPQWPLLPGLVAQGRG